ncbi:DNA cytosine methyltransferase [Oceaniglobus ichthyenteri]|uniref:DNA cytosine methyltransferase n=1 Tax=Oceaniglobus ichthyenteri TaxID=2136177 RepID=UPI000D396F93|nr:DNA cytosine methyltransferase [Oceaniglobus ichthyenteri]
MFDAAPETELPMIIDSFAGGGGASTGIELALGRSPDVAINHNAAALALHAVNHPETLHLDSNIWDVAPLDVTKGRHVGLLWASPDCKHFSKAKGGAPKDRNIRDLAWVVVDWAEQVRPDVILMENVEEFLTWGPLGEDGQPLKEFSGMTFELWAKRLRRAGYRVQWRELRACDYGAPTIRKRFFMVARRDGRPISWPKPTHGDPKSPAVKRGHRLPWRTAAECIDWSLPCPSIFDTGPQIMEKHGLRAVRPLAKNTMARVARGMKRYVLDSADPFIVNIANSKTTTAGGQHHALGAPLLATMRNSQKPWQGCDEPTHTITAGGAGLTTIAAFIAQHHTGATGHDARDPLSTVAATGSHQTPIAAWFAKYYGTGDGAPTGDPMHTVTVKDRMGHMQAALSAPPFTKDHATRARDVADFMRAHEAWDDREFVTINIQGATFVIVDIGMRMLTPRELFHAQGFPADYVIEGHWTERDGEYTWTQFPKNVQVSCCGNSVCPPLAEALVRANCKHLMKERIAA